MTDDEPILASDSGPAASTAYPIKARLYVMMFLQYFVQGCYLPIISVYLQDALGFGSRELGMFGSALAVGPLAAPFIIGQIVDRHMATERVLAFCHLAGGVLMFALFVQKSFWPAVILGTMYSTLYVPTMMLTNSLTFYHLKDRDREFPAIRLWGTIGFVVPAWLIELYFLRGLSGDELNEARGVALAISGIAGLVMGLYSWTLPHTPPPKSEQKDLAPGKVVGLLSRRSVLVLVLASLAIAVAHKFYFVWNSPYLKVILEKGGIEGAWEQRIASIGQISEVVVMAGLGLAIVRLGFKWVMLFGAVAYLARCLVFAWAVMLDVDFSAVMSLVCFGQALHGFCFGCFLAAAYMYVDRVSPLDVRGTAQNVYGTFILGLGFFLGGFISGDIGEAFTTQAGTATLRDTLGVTSRAGLATLTQTENGATREFVRDWPAIWLAGAVLAGLGALAFALLFPPDRPSSDGAETALPRSESETAESDEAIG